MANWLYHEDEGTTIPRNVGNYNPNNTANYPRRSGSSRIKAVVTSKLANIPIKIFVGESCGIRQGTIVVIL
jgi:hypothetical protein